MLKIGSGAKAKMRQPGADGEHEDQRARGEHDGVGGVHDCRAQQHADGVKVVGGAGHDVAGAGALIEAVGKPLQMREQIVAQVEFDLARDADQDPARQELEDGFDAGDGQQHEGVGQEFVTGYALVEIVDGAANDQRKENPDPVVEQNAHGAKDIGGAVLAKVGKQRAQVREHKPSAISRQLSAKRLVGDPSRL